MGLGVVVTTKRGSLPSLSPSSRLSQQSWAYFHFANSSHQAWWCCGPRSCSGASPEYVVAMVPLGQVRRRLDGSYFGASHGGQHDKMPRLTFHHHVADIRRRLPHQRNTLLGGRGPRTDLLSPGARLAVATAC